MNNLDRFQKMIRQQKLCKKCKRLITRQEHYTIEHQIPEPEYKATYYKRHVVLNICPECFEQIFEEVKA